jgi:hypothetical protein
MLPLLRHLEWDRRNGARIRHLRLAGAAIFWKVKGRVGRDPPRRKRALESLRLEFRSEPGTNAAEAVIRQRPVGEAVEPPSPASVLLAGV